MEGAIVRSVGTRHGPARPDRARHAVVLHAGGTEMGDLRDHAEAEIRKHDADDGAGRSAGSAVTHSVAISDDGVDNGASDTDDGVDAISGNRARDLAEQVNLI